MSDARDFSPLGSLVQPNLGEGSGRFGLNRGGMIEVARTLMKSEPELSELVRGVEGVEVSMAEKGFGTRVELRAGEGSGLAESDLERILDGLAEPRKQPFA
jgi:hypothetical protein